MKSATTARIPDLRRRRLQCVILTSSSALLKTLDLILSGLGWRATTTCEPEEAWSAMLNCNPALLIADLHPSAACALALTLSARQEGWKGNAIAISAPGYLADTEALRRLGIKTILTKPFRLVQLKAAIDLWYLD